MTTNSNSTAALPTEAAEEWSHIAHEIEHAAHFLPSQGPITAFVHHNTLHALEKMDFCDAVLEGAELFGCHPYLPEIRYREKVASGRIGKIDLEAVLLEDLGDRADVLLGFLGLRIRLRQAILEYPLHDGPADDLRWVIADSNALKKFREDAPALIREQFLADTKQWISRDFGSLADTRTMAGASEKSKRLHPALKMAIEEQLKFFGASRIESWSPATWESFSLHLLWRICEHGVAISGFQAAPHAPRFKRLRDLLQNVTCEDSDELVNEFLIRFCGTFLDQGFSHWHLPDRDTGFYQCFLKLFGETDWLVQPWRRGLAAYLRNLSAESISPLESIRQSLRLLGVDASEQENYLTQTVLALSGFAGMIWQLETRGDRVYRPMPAGTLIEYVAVRLILEQFALSSVARNTLDYNGSLSELADYLKREFPPRSNSESDAQRNAFRLFEIGQLLGWKPKHLARLSPAEWNLVLQEIHAFPAIERRRIYHLAFERKFRNQALDAFMIHASRVREKIRPVQRPNFQIVSCIDEREESFRRALEEVDPDCETLSAAGFFAVPIYYRGAADAHFTPLCPVVIQPKHYVREEVLYSLQGAESNRRKTRRTIGTVTHRVHMGSRTFTGGWIGSTLFGTLATFPLVARILFPRLTAQARRTFGSLVRPPELTELRLERIAEEPGPLDDQLGFSVEEMANCVCRLLTDIGLTTNLSRLIIIAGHGSSSMNNPHDAAYDCGACSGGRGGPNARSFAQMANHQRVRQIVASRGISIPLDTVFLGGYHNTCDDSMTFYDLDRLPPSHRPDLQAAHRTIDIARRMGAQERCRRFVSAPLTLTPDLALKHVENRAEDLSQVRSECGHATNAICLVGSREWSRGLFLDRRAFMHSYSAAQDDQRGTVLERILQPVIPVCGGINLEYFFSFIDPVGYGCGTKLPHNVTALLGVMNGAASDLRTGLPWQMVEIHEPMRLLFVIETTAEVLQRIIDNNPPIEDLCNGNWVQIAIFDPATSVVQLYRNREFVPYQIQDPQLDVTASSAEWHRGWRDHLKFASVGPRFASFENSDNPTNQSPVGKGQR